MEKTPKLPVARTVDEYLERLPETVRATLEKVRSAIKKAAPMAEEKISYQIPGYVWNGPVAYFAAFKNHCSYFTTSFAIMKACAEELKPYRTSGVTIQFPLNKPLPATLIKKMVLAKLVENETRLLNRKQQAATKKKAAAKKAKKTAKKK